MDQKLQAAKRYLQERGREWFHIDVHADGHRTISAHCEITTGRA